MPHNLKRLKGPDKKKVKDTKWLRGDWILQNGCFFGKLPKGGGSFPIQKITLQILLVSKRYILGKKAQCNFQKGGRGGGHRQSKKFHCKFTHT